MMDPNAESTPESREKAMKLAAEAMRGLSYDGHPSNLATPLVYTASMIDQYLRTGRVNRDFLPKAG